MSVSGTVRSVTGGGRGAPTTRRHTVTAVAQGYGLFVPRGATATGPHGVHPGTGHIAHVNGGRSVHPAINKPFPVRPGPRIPTPSRPVRRGPVSPVRGVPVRRGPFTATQPGLPPPVPPPIIVPSVVVDPPGPGKGAVTQVGGLVQQTNAGGTTSGVGGGSAYRSTTGYFENLGGSLDNLGISWMTAAEVAALAFGALLLWRYTGKRRGRR